MKVKDKQPKDEQSNLVYEQAVKTRVNQHQRPRTNKAQNSVVYTYQGHWPFNISDASILDNEEQWHQCGIKEAIWERVEDASLNKKGGLCFNLSHVWERTIKLIPSRLSHDDQSSGSVAWRSLAGARRNVAVAQKMWVPVLDLSIKFNVDLYSA